MNSSTFHTLLSSLLLRLVEEKMGEDSQTISYLGRGATANGDAVAKRKKLEEAEEAKAQQARRESLDALSDVQAKS
jgi:hypothetical protein